MKYSLIETLMGFSVILVAILFLFFGFSLEKNINSKSISISAIFENVTGLSVGDKVKISGITVGKIIISLLSAFAFVYFRFPFRNLCFWLIFITLMLPV